VIVSIDNFVESGKGSRRGGTAVLPQARTPGRGARVAENGVRDTRSSSAARSGYWQNGARFPEIDKDLQ